jgi:hypothetical protein
MQLRERYCGVEFTIRENGDWTCSWEIQPFDGLPVAERDFAGTVKGGQNEAILAARTAIHIYLDQNVKHNTISSERP